MASTTKTTAPSLPTAFLPPLKQLHTLTAHSLSLVVPNLADLYQPDLRTLHRSLIPDIVDSGYASGNEDDKEPATIFNDQEADGILELEEAWALARADPLERAYALRWMTGFIARASEWVEAAGSDENGDNTEEYEEREAVLEAILALLGACSQTSESGALLRHFSFPQARGQPNVNVALQDEDLSPTDHTSVGLQTWGSATIMIQRLCRYPELYGLGTRDDISKERPLRILELGAGTGLLTLAVGSLLVQQGIEAEIVATDYHPDVLQNLSQNVKANPASVSSSVDITVAPLDWSMIHNDPTVELGESFDKPFDVILAADVVYRPNHADWIASSVSKLLQHPSLNPHAPQPSLHLIAPTRPTHEKTHSSIETAFPKESSHKEHPGHIEGNDARSAMTLCSVEMFDHPRAKGVGRADEEGYREYRIEWR